MKIIKFIAGFFSLFVGLVLIMIVAELFNVFGFIGDAIDWRSSSNSSESNNISKVIYITAILFTIYFIYLFLKKKELIKKTNSFIKGGMFGVIFLVLLPFIILIYSHFTPTPKKEIRQDWKTELDPENYWDKKEMERRKKNASQLLEHDTIKTQNEPEFKSIKNGLFFLPKAKISILKLRLIESHSLMQYWTKNKSRQNHPNKTKVNSLINEKILIDLGEINQLFTDQRFSANNKEQLSKINANIKLLFNTYEDIKVNLSNFSNYEDPMSLFLSEMTYESESKPLFESIIIEINELDSMIFY